jgi:ATP-dependent 26S proteasome regulatory subunit
LVHKTSDFSGAEIAYLVTEAVTLALSGDRSATFDDLETVLGEMTPQADLDYENLELIRSWARKLARLAS